MQIFQVITFLLTVSFFLFSGFSNAGIIYSAESTAIISLNSSSPDDISFVNITGNYSAFGTASSDGTLAVDSATTPFNRSGSFESLDDLLSPFTSGATSPFDSINAVIGGAEGRGRNESYSSVNVARFNANAFGEVTDPIEDAYSRVRWDVLVAFKNTSLNSISFSWDVNYLFSNTATSGDHGTAFSMSSVSAQQGKLDNGERNTDPNIFKATAAKCGATTTCLPGDNDGIPFTFDYNLGAGEIGFLNFEVVAQGSASVVKEPNIHWIFCTALIMALGFSQRRKMFLVT